MAKGGQEFKKEHVGGPANGQQKPRLNRLRVGGREMRKQA